MVAVEELHVDPRFVGEAGLGAKGRGVAVAVGRRRVAAVTVDGAREPPRGARKEEVAQRGRVAPKLGPPIVGHVVSLRDGVGDGGGARRGAIGPARPKDLAQRTVEVARFGREGGAAHEERQQRDEEGALVVVVADDRRHVRGAPALERAHRVFGQAVGGAVHHRPPWHEGGERRHASCRAMTATWRGGGGAAAWRGGGERGGPSRRRGRRGGGGSGGRAARAAARAPRSVAGRSSVGGVPASSSARGGSARRHASSAASLPSAVALHPAVAARSRPQACASPIGWKKAGKSQRPDSRMARWKRPRDAGAARCQHTLIAPADSPKSVIAPGSPPKARALSRAQRSASRWSRVAQLPVVLLSRRSWGSDRKPSAPTR